MNILISNDDGIGSEGLIILAKRLAKNHNVMVVAPDSNRSAYSHSLSIRKKLILNKVDIGDNITAYSLSGTPVDCVKFAEHAFEDFKTDLVITGINKGHNLGTDIIYSGTVSAACEGGYFGHISLAFSSVSHENSDFDMCTDFAVEVIDYLLPLSKAGSIWNINIPALPKEQIRGIKFAPLGKQIYSDRYEFSNGNEYILVGTPLSHYENVLNCDVELIKRGYITVTPLEFDRTDYKKLRAVERLCKKK